MYIGCTRDAQEVHKRLARVHLLSSSCTPLVHGERIRCVYGAYWEPPRSRNVQRDYESTDARQRLGARTFLSAARCSVGRASVSRQLWHSEVAAERNVRAPLNKYTRWCTALCGLCQIRGYARRFTRCHAATGSSLGVWEKASRQYASPGTQMLAGGRSAYQ